MMIRITLLIAGLLLVPGPANAERVYVKARGEVDLASFRCENIARSENVKRLCYDERESYVLVSLKGIWYHFCGVPATTVTSWKKSASKGRYYNDVIRGNFDCHEASTPTYR
ncbi:MAG TPA: KTSC domain-containing protein [Burkholderiaceae bacterium]|nr:KTSC domain-containing protein [Burkholderiaceae bacterium]